MNLALIGGGEMAFELFGLIVSCNEKNKYEKIFFVDLAEDKTGNIIAEEDFFRSDPNESEILIAMGEPFMRMKMAKKYAARGFKMTSFIHPLAFVSSNTRIGNGTIILPYAYVAQNVNIGENIILHSGVKIENDCSIERDCYFNGNAFVGAKTRIGNACFVGPNAVIRDGLVIGSNAIVGMGAVVTKSVEEHAVYYGNPAKKVRDNISHKVFK